MSETPVRFYTTPQLKAGTNVTITPLSTGELEISSTGEGHGGVDYNTTEQNTGLTWVDGKPVYQKTITVADWDGTSPISHDITGMTTLISATATVRTGV